MDDSRSVLPPSAETPDSGQISVRRNPYSNLSCRICGGTDLRVEVRRGDVVTLADLRVYQQVAYNPMPGFHRLLTCERCDQSFQEARRAVRERLLARLVFAARNLADTQFARTRRNGAPRRICVECRMPQEAGDSTRHKNSCRVGSVLGLLSALMELDAPEVLLGLNDVDLGAKGTLPLAAAGCAEQGGAR